MSGIPSQYARSTRSFHQRQQGWGDSFLQKRRLFKDWVLLVSVIILTALTYVWTRIAIIETGYRIVALRDAQKLLKEDQSKLSLEAATLRNPERLEDMARNDFGFVRPKTDQVVYLSNLSGTKKDN